MAMTRFALLLPQIKDEYAAVEHMTAPGPKADVAKPASAGPAAGRAAAGAAAGPAAAKPEQIESKSATAKLINAVSASERCAAGPLNPSAPCCAPHPPHPQRTPCQQCSTTAAMLPQPHTTKSCTYPTTRTTCPHHMPPSPRPHHPPLPRHTQGQARRGPQRPARRRPGSGGVQRRAQAVRPGGHQGQGAQQRGSQQAPGLKVA